ncbi:MAG: enoyl-CoA hydratase [Candidatus Rokubacteria bacterium]|nr:enoyl-CoA hydratase [Candidatus Rokubacteria bacterium]
MGYEHILYDVAGRIATVTLNRPERLNAWTVTMEREVREAMAAAAGDDGVRVIVFTGAGRGFCAGADMDLLQSIPGGGVPAESERPRPFDPSARGDFQRKYSWFPAVPKPIIAAINGPAAGLGLVIALYCDVRIAAEGAVFTTSFSRRGLIAEHGISWLLPRLVGPANALDLLLSARKIDAATALRMGLVNDVLPQARFRDGVSAYAGELAALVSPRSMRVMKRQVWEAQFQTLAEATAVADEEMRLSFASEDFREGVAHFVGKRAPAFTGR